MVNRDNLDNLDSVSSVDLLVISGFNKNLVYFEEWMFFYEWSMEK